MTKLDKWIQINNIYNHSKPKRLLQDYILNGNFKANMLFIVILISPAIAGLLLLENRYFYLWMILVVVFYVSLIVALSDRFIQPVYMEHDIQKIPFLQRLNYLHYARFKNLCDEQGLNESNLRALLKWHRLSFDVNKWNKKHVLKVHVFVKMYLQENK